MASSSLLRGDAVLKGASLAIVVCLPLSLVADVVHDDHPDSALLPLLFLATLLGFVAAGWVAARAAGISPYSNGAVAALAGYGVLAVISIVVRLVGDKDVHPARIVGTALLAYAAGLLGGSLKRT
jgi:putative membrane protein (TIGR04086 family)